MEVPNCWNAALGLISKGDRAKAIDLCSTEPCSRSVPCQTFLGWTYYQKNDLATATTWFLRAAKAGDAEAQFGLGSIYFVQRDFSSAVRCYEAAAGDGYSRAFYLLGYLCEHGLGAPRDIEKAVRYNKQAAAAGYIVAERALIHLAFQHGNVLQKILAVPRLLLVIVKAAVIAYRNINDPRIVDVPNVFAKKESQRSPADV